MKYNELFTLNPIETVIELNDADDKDKARQLISTFVITKSLDEAISNIAIPQLDFSNPVEGKGIFIVGNYGTGKSHVMSFLSILAEDKSYINYVTNEQMKSKLSSIAGKYKVCRQQISGSKMNLYDIVVEQLIDLSKNLGFDFTFKTLNQISNVKLEFNRFMQVFYTLFPDTGVLVIIDELLHYLESRNDQDLFIDLSVLQALGEFSDESRFVFMAGLQQSLFNNPRFHHVASALNRVKRRFYDFVIDNEGISQLIEQYLFRKNESQKAIIKTIIESNSKLYETVSTDINRFIDLFPAHPKFIDEFQRVFVVERREILTVLSQEARGLYEQDINVDGLDLITSDKYWKHIEKDTGLRSNRDVSKVIQNVSTLTSSINNNFNSVDEKEAAKKLIFGLAVNRLTTYSINDPVGLTPEDLKNNLLWKTNIAVADPVFLTLAAKRLLERTREAANGQFLAASDTSGQYFIDPTRDVDYEQRVNSLSKTLSNDVLQRYLNEIVTRALEIDNSQPVIEGRLWQYRLPWPSKNVERPGWLFFGFPNQRSTAKPAKDFYLFFIPSKRITGFEETWEQKNDEIYWFVEDFPPSKYEESSIDESDTHEPFVDLLRKYAASQEQGSQSRSEEKVAYQRISNRLLERLLPQFIENSGDWISIQFNGQKHRLKDWVTRLAPASAAALFKTKFEIISQLMINAHFEEKYPDYPSFTVSIQEDTRSQAVQAALEIICGVGMVTKVGKAVLSGLELYDDVTPTPDRSPWLHKIRHMLSNLEDGQVLNHSDVFDVREERTWMKGGFIEGDWLHVVLGAALEQGDLVIFGPNNTKYDASNIRDFFRNIKNPEQIIRIGKPIQTPLNKWRKLFGILEINKGLLASQVTYQDAVTEFQAKLAELIINIVDNNNKLKSNIPFSNSLKQEVLGTYIKNYDDTKRLLEPLQSINARPKMAYLNLGDEEIDRLESMLNKCYEIDNMLKFIDENHNLMSTLERYQNILENEGGFQESLLQFITDLNALYSDSAGFSMSSSKEMIQSKLNNMIVDAIATYRKLQKHYSLDRDGDARKKRLLQSDELKRLNKMSLIRVVNKPALTEIHNMLSSLPIYQSCTDEELINSPTSLCPITKFDPRQFVDHQYAVEKLKQCEDGVILLNRNWEEQIIKELKETALALSLQVLKPEERKIIEIILQQEKMPEEINEVIISAINNALSGLKRKTMKASNFAKRILGEDGVPLKAEEIKLRFETWLTEQIGTDQPETIRFVLED